MTTLLPTEITSYTMPTEIVTHELAVAYVKFWEVKLIKLIKAGTLSGKEGAKIRKAYEQRLRLALWILAFHPAEASK